MKFKHIGVHKMQGAIEESGNCPVVSFKRGAAKLGGKGFVRVSLLEVLCGIHPQATATADENEARKTRSQHRMMDAER